MPLPVVKYNSKELDLLARLMRAEAESDGKTGMMLVGMVGINRVRANCLDFKNISSIYQMVFQSPGGFESVRKSYFYQGARESDKKLAKKVINGELFEPGKRALWFFNPGDTSCPAQWFNQWNSGKYKTHCFYAPVENENCY